MDGMGVLADYRKPGLFNDKLSHLKAVLYLKVLVCQGFHITIQVVNYKGFANTAGNMRVSRLQ
jgi:hypothetical protein